MRRSDRKPKGVSRSILAALAACALFAPHLAAAVQPSARRVADEGPRTWAIRGATAHVGDGSVLSGATVVLRDGLIEAVLPDGSDMAAPPDASVIEADGMHVYPGFVSALGDIGLRAAGGEGGPGGGAAPQGRGGQGGAPPAAPTGPEDRPATHSDRRAAAEVQVSDPRIAARRNAGFTSAVAVPRGGIVSGHAAFLNLAGADPRDFVVEDDVALMVRLETGGFRSFPGSMMGVIAYVRQLFLDAGHYAAAEALYDGNPEGLARPRFDPALAPLGPAAAGDYPVLLPAVFDKEVRRMTRLARELGLQPVLYGGHEAAASAPFLAEHRVPILVNLDWPDADPDADPEAEIPLRELRIRDQAPAGPAALEAAGVEFAFYRGEGRARSGRGGAGGRGGGGAPDDLAAVRQAVERGLSKEAALAALTLAPARIFGVEDRVGSLAPGLIANVVVADGDLFEEGARIEAVFVDGVIHRPDSDDSDDEEETGSGDRGESR